MKGLNRCHRDLLPLAVMHKVQNAIFNDSPGRQREK